LSERLWWSKVRRGLVRWGGETSIARTHGWEPRDPGIWLVLPGRFTATFLMHLRRKAANPASRKTISFAVCRSACAHRRDKTPRTVDVEKVIRRSESDNLGQTEIPQLAYDKSMARQKIVTLMTSSCNAYCLSYCKCLRLFVSSINNK
jgi:hypothetical protein